MTTRKIFSILLVANLLTVALVTAVFQAGNPAMAGPAPRPVSDQGTAYDPNLYPTVPWMMNYQGILKDSGGAPLTGSHNLTFTIYRWDQTLSQFVSVWTETHNGVNLTNGLFDVELGLQGSPLRGDAFAGLSGTWDGALELGVKVDGGTELTPRAPLLSVPYAHRAEYVNRFPAPHYDSGWQNVSAGNNYFTHNLGGNTDNYVVDLQFKETPAATYGVHQHFYGMDYDDIQGSRGAYWYWLTTSTITVYVGPSTTNINQVRVRIWRIE
jgi:hypothetical protein